MGTSERRRVARLIDQLIDDAHTRCPDHHFVLRLPSGEDVDIPPHDPIVRCAAIGHSGYFLAAILPFLATWVVPVTRRGELLGVMTAPALHRATGSGSDAAHGYLHDCGSLSVDLRPARMRPTVRLPGSRVATE